ncbi:MAG: TolC family protein [Schleiferiaceae bacterium]|jgi:outer membrane protein TolC|nr:TolC family protein [Schleiferiaceae bacterium]
MYRRLIHIILFFAPLFVVAQGESIDSKADLVKYLPPLPVLIDSAILNSPRLAHYGSMVESYEHNVSLTKMKWTNHFRIMGQYNYGDIGSIPNSAFLGKQLSVGFSIPLGSVANRKSEINIAVAQLEAEENTYEQVKLEVQEDVIETYNDLLLFQRLIGIQAEAMQSAELAMEMAEERFRRGELSMDQLGTYIELQAKYKTAYETMRTEFNNAYNKLERIVGVPFSEFES